MQLTDKEWIEHFENIAKMSSDIASIKEAIEGNGDPGLAQRVETVENTIEAHSNRLIGFSAAFSTIGTILTYIGVSKLQKWFPGMFA